MAHNSIREVAQQAGVSVGTVSNVLNRPDVVAPATQQRVMDAIRELGFVRHEAAPVDSGAVVGGEERHSGGGVGDGQLARRRRLR